MKNVTVAAPLPISLFHNYSLFAACRPDDLPLYCIAVSPLLLHCAAPLPRQFQIWYEWGEV